MNTKCWLFGHTPQEDWEDKYPKNTCLRCFDYVGYDDLISPSRYQEVKMLVAYWLCRKWFPAKCSDCGKRYSNHMNCIITGYQK